MTDNRSDEQQRLLLLADFMLDDLFSTSDEDIVAEAEEAGDDLVSIPNRMRELYQQTLLKKRKARLQTARDRLHSSSAPRLPVGVIDIAKARLVVSEALKNSELSVAARNETSDELSDAEIERKYHQLVELGLIDPEN